MCILIIFLCSSGSGHTFVHPGQLLHSSYYLDTVLRSSLLWTPLFWTRTILTIYATSYLDTLFIDTLILDTHSSYYHGNPLSRHPCFGHAHAHTIWATCYVNTLILDTRSLYYLSILTAQTELLCFVVLLLHSIVMLTLFITLFLNAFPNAFPLVSIQTHPDCLP